jgi:hypothetical protein
MKHVARMGKLEMHAYFRKKKLSKKNTLQKLELMRGYLKRALKTGCKCEMDATGSGYGPLAVYTKHNNGSLT